MIAAIAFQSLTKSFQLSFWKEDVRDFCLFSSSVRSSFLYFDSFVHWYRRFFKTKTARNTLSFLSVSFFHLTFSLYYFFHLRFWLLILCVPPSPFPFLSCSLPQSFSFSENGPLKKDLLSHSFRTAPIKSKYFQVDWKFNLVIFLFLKKIQRDLARVGALAT